MSKVVTTDKAISAIVVAFNKFSCDEVEKAMERLFKELKDNKKKSLILEVANRCSQPELADLFAYAEDAEEPKAKKQKAKKAKGSEQRENYEFSKNQIKAIRKALEFLNIKGERTGRFMGILSGKLVKTQGVLSKDIVKDAAKIAHVRFDDDEQEGIFYGIINRGFSESHDENPQEATDESKPAETVESHDEGNESTEVKA